jgi:hypothetical protein
MQTYKCKRGTRPAPLSCARRASPLPCYKILGAGGTSFSIAYQPLLTPYCLIGNTSCTRRPGDMAASPVAIGTAVFQRGPLRVEARHVDYSQVPSVPKPLMVVAPTDAGVYPVAVFLHGCNTVNSWYESLLSHVASHGFIAVAPQVRLRRRHRASIDRVHACFRSFAEL